MNDQLLTQLGVSGVVVVFLSIALRTVWSSYQAALAQNRDDQERVLPALAAASAAMTEVARVANRMADRERGL